MNMSYCRFQNTLNDLRDCQEHLEDGDLSRDEFRAMKKLIEICEEIVAEAGAMEEDGDLPETFEEYKENNSDPDDQLFDRLWLPPGPDFKP